MSVGLGNGVLNVLQKDLYVSDLGDRFSALYVFNGGLVPARALFYLASANTVTPLTPDIIYDRVIPPGTGVSHLFFRRGISLPPRSRIVGNSDENNVCSYFLWGIPFHALNLVRNSILLP